jgi:hypothetical protein
VGILESLDVRVEVRTFLVSISWQIDEYNALPTVTEECVSPSSLIEKDSFLFKAQVPSQSRLASAAFVIGNPITFSWVGVVIEKIKELSLERSPLSWTIIRQFKRSTVS